MNTSFPRIPLAAEFHWIAVEFSQFLFLSFKFQFNLLWNVIQIQTQELNGRQFFSSAISLYSRDLYTHIIQLTTVSRKIIISAFNQKVC